MQPNVIFVRAVQSTSTSAPPHSSTTAHTTFTSSSSLTSTSSTPSSNFTYFPDPSTLHPPPNPEEAERNLAKNIVGYVVLALVLLVILFTLLQRFYYLRRNNQPLTHFFRFVRSSAPRSGSQNTLTSPLRPYSRPRLRPLYDPDDDTTYQNPSVFDDVRYPITASQHLSPDLRHLPLSYYPYGIRTGARRTTAAGVDEQGRRLDSGRDPDQLSMNDKDVLPPYDRYGGPPKYMDLELALDGTMMMDRLRAAAEVENRDGGRASTPAVDESTEELNRGRTAESIGRL